METYFNLFLCRLLEMSVFSSLKTNQLMTLFYIVCLCALKIINYSKKDWPPFIMRLAGRFYLMVNQILINAEGRIGFQQSIERLAFEETAFFHLHSTCEADI